VPVTTIFGFVVRGETATPTPAAAHAAAVGDAARVAESTGTPESDQTRTSSTATTLTLKPVPYAEIEVESEHLHTVAVADADGAFSIEAPQTDTLTLKSSVPALKFVDINGTPIAEISGDALTLTAQNPFLITAEPQIKQGSMCQFTQNGQAYVRFPYTQRTGEALTVLAGSRNYLISESGTQLPAEQFQTTEVNQSDNTTSFSRPLSEFTAPNGSLTLEWYLYGSLAVREDPLPLCEAEGELKGCTPVSITGIDRVFNEVLGAATDISRVIVAKRSKVILSGRTRLAFYQGRVAPALARLRGVLNAIPSSAYVCPVQPASCSTRRLPKKEILDSLEFLFKTKWPKNVKPIVKNINKLAPKARKRITDLLNQYPNSITTCN
jgi:hypothetical protein